MEENKISESNFNKKYRQRELEHMIGSLNVRTSLSTLLKNKKFPHAIILCGDNGIGKTTAAYCCTAKLICGCGKPECEVCKELTEQLWEYKNRSFTNVYEFDLGQHKDDSDYIDSIFETFLIAGRKVLIIDEIQYLKNSDMGKFLKTLERLDEETYVIFCTTELYKINTGIVSRCEVFELQVPNTFELAAYLETVCRIEGVKYDREGIYALAKMKYRVRDAIGSLETIININGGATKQDVMNYFGKANNKYPIEFLKATKESSPYVLLFLLEKIKEDIGLFKFTTALKEMLVDSVYAKYDVKPLFASDEDLVELKRIISIFTTEEVTHILKEVDRIQGKSNLDREIVLINLGFALSNGSLLRKSGVAEEKKFLKKMSESSMLENDRNLQDPMEETVGFTLEMRSEIGGNSDSQPKEVKRFERITDETSALAAVDALFNS